AWQKSSTSQNNSSRLSIEGLLGMLVFANPSLSHRAPYPELRLYIKSNEKNRYMDFDPAQFFVPKKNWKAPYPYCPDDVLFLIEQQDMKNDRILRQLPGSPILVGLEAQLLREQLPTNDRLGG
ncbi:MAG: hypothetical protein WBW94_03510, partial [Anaerolineales bacterium]